MLHEQEQHCGGSFVYSWGYSSAGHHSGKHVLVFRHLLLKLKRLGSRTWLLNETLTAAKCFRSLIGLLNSYLMVSSVVGFYSLRVFEGLTPRKDDTTMTTVKMGCKDRVCAKAGERMLKLLLRC